MIILDIGRNIEKRTISNIPRTVMVNKENYYREYKGHTKWLSLISSDFAKKKIFLCMTLLHAHAHYICIVCDKYQKASVKALVQADFLMYALSKHKHNPYLIGNKKKWLSSQSYHFVKINILASSFFTHKCSMCLYCVSKVLDCFSKSCGTSWLPCICTIYP